MKAQNACWLCAPTHGKLRAARLASSATPRPETRPRVSAVDMSESPTSNQPPDADYELLPAGLPAKGGGPGGGAGSGETPSNANDPRWAERAASQLMDTTGLRAVEVQQTIAELRKTQAAVSRAWARPRRRCCGCRNWRCSSSSSWRCPSTERRRRGSSPRWRRSPRGWPRQRRAAKLSGVEFPDYDGDGDDAATREMTPSPAGRANRTA